MARSTGRLIEPRCFRVVYVTTTLGRPRLVASSCTAPPRPRTRKPASAAAAPTKRKGSRSLYCSRNCNTRASDRRFRERQPIRKCRRCAKQLRPDRVGSQFCSTPHKRAFGVRLRYRPPCPFRAERKTLRLAGLSKLGLDSNQQPSGKQFPEASFPQAYSASGRASTRWF